MVPCTGSKDDRSPEHKKGDYSPAHRNEGKEGVCLGIVREDGTWYEWARKSAGKHWKMQMSDLRKDERNGN
jgi:hypothetical protein